ncbi:hypothetical protein ASD52_36425 [Ensifer sp. Root142]|nr:hypothetical protein ASD52_36425 [Ensifer sp. Root142]
MMNDLNKSLFADCEIRTLAFDYPNLTLKLFDSTEVDFYKLVFHNVEFFIFESDHLQNVISAMQVFDNLKDALLDSAFANYARQRKLEEELSKLIGNHRICYIRPITGGDMVIVFAEWEQQES